MLMAPPLDGRPRRTNSVWGPRGTAKRDRRFAADEQNPLPRPAHRHRPRLGPCRHDRHDPWPELEMALTRRPPSKVPAKAVEKVARVDLDEGEQQRASTPI